MPSPSSTRGRNRNIDALFNARKKIANIPAPLETLSLPAKKGRAKEHKVLTFYFKKLKAGDQFPKQPGKFFSLHYESEKYRDKLKELFDSAKTWAEDCTSARSWRQNWGAYAHNGLAGQRGWFVYCDELPPSPPEWGEVSP